MAVAAMHNNRFTGGRKHAVHGAVVLPCAACMWEGGVEQCAASDVNSAPVASPPRPALPLPPPAARPFASPPPPTAPAARRSPAAGTLPPEWGLQGYWWNATLNNTQALEYL